MDSIKYEINQSSQVLKFISQWIIHTSSSFDPFDVLASIVVDENCSISSLYEGVLLFLRCNSSNETKFDEVLCSYWPPSVVSVTLTLDLLVLSLVLEYNIVVSKKENCYGNRKDINIIINSMFLHCQILCFVWSLPDDILVTLNSVGTTFWVVEFVSWYEIWVSIVDETDGLNSAALVGEYSEVVFKVVIVSKSWYNSNNYQIS